jgi:hypothetical protein
VRRHLRHLLGRIRGRLAEDSAALRAYRRVRHWLEWLRHERRQAVDTSPHISPAALGIEGPDRMGYEPTRWKSLPTLLPRSEVSPSDVFVDFGSGMGRMVQQAAAYPFARVVGVEVSEQLNQVARRNYAANRQRLACKDVDFVTCDAVEFPIPDDLTHAYLFNPFVGETFRRVVANIVASVDRAPRRTLLIYQNPLMKEALEQTERFRLLAECTTALQYRALIYEIVPKGDRRLDAAPDIALR